MQSQLANMFIEIMDRIKDKVPAIRYINFDMGQIDFYDGLRPKVSFPALLIDYGNFVYSDLGRGVQEVRGEIKFRLAFSPYSNSSSLSPAEVRAKALEYLEIDYTLNQFLHGWQGTDFGALTRIAAITEEREDTLRVRATSYAVNFFDSSASPATTLMDDPAINVQAEGPTGNVVDSNP